MQRWDVGRAFRGVGWDSAFPADAMMPSLEATLGELGVDLHAQPNVEIDVEERPNKDPRAFCAPIEVPGRVVLVIKPQGGPDDWRALFHEAGHTEHFAHTSASLSPEERRLGDNAVTEGWAMLLEHLTFDPVWLVQRLDFAQPHQFAAEGATQLLWLVRRYCAKLLYELEFHAADDVTSMRPRYVELLGDATKVEPAAADYLGDMDAGFYASEYLRAWAFEAQLRVVPPGEVRQRVVLEARRRLAAPRAVGGGPEADRRRAARGRDGRAPRACGRRRPRARGARRRLASSPKPQEEDSQD